MQKFPSIDQFRQVVREIRFHSDYAGKDENGDAIYKHTGDYPIITFKGTVKLHGTNAAIVKYKDRIEYQSRERVLSLDADNCQFMAINSKKNLNFLFDGLEFNESIAIFGEWCGQGIQSGVGISSLPKMFVIFAISVDGEFRRVIMQPNYELANSLDIYYITQFPTYIARINFNAPELIQNELVSLTEEVEKECPVAKHFGVSGIGEGIVWTATHNDHHYIFKVKGEKHSVSKVKTLASVDVEQVESAKQFVESVVTENRLQQGVQVLKERGVELDQKATGDYLRWVIGDIAKEESDTIQENGLDIKKVNPLISNKARVWFFKYLDSLAINA